METTMYQQEKAKKKLLSLQRSLRHQRTQNHLQINSSSMQKCLHLHKRVQRSEEDKQKKQRVRHERVKGRFTRGILRALTSLSAFGLVLHRN